MIQKFRGLRLADITPSEEASFWDLVNIRWGGNGCWEWVGSIEPNGYGRFKINGVRHLVHRVSYAMGYGVLPPNLLVCHACYNRRCVRPDHLFLGTHQENTADMIRKGRKPLGDQVITAKLTKADVLEILASSGTARSVGERFGVSKSCIEKIRTGKNWKGLGKLPESA